MEKKIKVKRAKVNNNHISLTRSLTHLLTHSLNTQSLNYSFILSVFLSVCLSPLSLPLSRKVQTLKLPRLIIIVRKYYSKESCLITPFFFSHHCAFKSVANIAKSVVVCLIVNPLTYNVELDSWCVFRAKHKKRELDSWYVLRATCDKHFFS